VSYAIAGAASGVLVASLFIAVAPIMLFVLAKEPSPWFRAVLDRVSPMVLMMGVVVLAFPAWTILGAAIGLLYRAMGTGADGAAAPGLYTPAVVLAAILLAAPLAVLLRRVAVGIGALTLTFIGVFGWVLPFLAG
jgi:hypothetical protein